MKILHIYKDYYPVLGGIENHIRILAEAQVKAGHDVTVLVTSPDHQTKRVLFNGVKIIFAGRLATVASTPISPAMFWWMRRLHADIAHLHFPHPPGEVANFLFHPAPRTVITYHSDIVRQQTLLRFYRPLLRQVLLRADQIIVTSPVYLETSPYLKQCQDKCTVIPLGVDVSRFDQITLSQVNELRAQLQLSDDTTVVLFVGRLRYYKGLDILLYVLREIPAAHLLIVGDGPMRASWEKQTHELGLAERITFLGEVSDDVLPVCYKCADVFVLPANSRAEAFGTVILEAMAARLPVISTEVGSGTSWVNQNGVTGYVVPSNDTRSLFNALKTLIDHPAMCLSMGDKAHARVIAEFSQFRMIEQVEAVYSGQLDGML